MTAPVTTAKRRKQLKRPSADEWINKKWSLHAQEWYSAITGDELLRHGSVDELESMMLRKGSQRPRMAMPCAPRI